MNNFSSEQKSRNTLRRSEFSLIELLVVIAILGILASLLLPALKGAKDMAEKILCTGNLKQIGLATNMYALDFKGYTPGDPATSNDGQFVVRFHFKWVPILC